ncbi:MAG: tRNA uridine-5-carboxymethylaminomethyl(34) synthesis GTPase MnmE [Omnitrophica bacterium RIFCSPLOWO2_12_FULL_44_17]|uniref:tRNA modification GTPase MnmE n=1 Tax=Candidatus Danuiimicrobium aquiferis TaxID=1801832 RepID=A0A1G1L381_9BACT|nr:MAG: tRNA uridine-5-carboxymethylaminomethyl(34) synthesis GTPase MnmE [Omnitrophica bacterium RIFCSPHIGHO2_02_FULL_45_28]OGW92283.1 MAG: tRNA uridine-5-carboxymethylaminomethyl(34) synthesis GTPase MnmE [Omnitrophica bacterium RIFCSPHIGHO2_12_FULL_44_12]OGW99588.1 MAG: tRNA uridine-5-carboxymethylaminomethyl(34) synthesis GTPase MnmE [Omnitrophica bacterium RIFCSPLOWO2_12_FULL_44_17]OGX04021.1 MAG: tRNA uridine-5-carboxymethylaminomethyl(34) synthesis GTPase MnmE [Omnitrophica bacterium RIFC
MHIDDTIVAIATASGEGAIGIVRLSGKDAVQIADRVFQAANRVKLGKADSHTVHHGFIHDEKGQQVDEVLATVFRSPRSYTGEDLVEIGAHGGMKILKNILSLFLRTGARQADPGEFTRRAFLNGRMDLAQAEAVLDLIRAKTDQSVTAAMSQLKGELSKRIQELKERLMLLYAHMEAYLDFPEDHLDVYSNEEFENRFKQVTENLRTLIHSYAKGEIVREGALVVIVGRPNVGKSSLMNALLERDRAIVSDIPGTTRDVLEESIEIGGFWIRLVDMAGLGRESDHPLDREAALRAEKYLEEGDLFLWMVDATANSFEEDLKIKKRLLEKPVISVANKTDLIPKTKWGELRQKTGENDFCFISATAREGLGRLEGQIEAYCLQQDKGTESILITRARHKQALEHSLEALLRSHAAFLQKESLEFVTVDLKAALDALKELVGEIYSEDLLDLIFQEFCVGK